LDENGQPEVNKDVRKRIRIKMEWRIQLESPALSHDFNGGEPTLTGYIYDLVSDPTM
jgi:hypothetical protein